MLLELGASGSMQSFLIERDDPTGTDAVDDDSVEVKVMSLKGCSCCAAVLGREHKQLTSCLRGDSCLVEPNDCNS